MTSFLTGFIIGAALVLLALLPLIRHLSIDPSYGVLTRAAAELRLRFRRGALDLVLLDIDGMKALNTQFGYAEMNRRIREALSTLPLRGNDIIWRHFSGDEFGAAVAEGTGEGLADRLASALAAQGLTACVHVQPTRNVRVAIEDAERVLLALKAARLGVAHAA